MFLHKRIKPRNSQNRFLPYAPHKAVWREAAPAADSGAPSGVAGDPPAEGSPDPVPDTTDYKALFESEKAERERIQAESIQRKNKLKEFETAQAQAEAEKQKAERDKLAEIDRIKLEKEDLGKTLSAKDQAIQEKEKELFSARVELEAVRAGANNSKYIEFLVKEHLGTLSDDNKAAFQLKPFIEGLKKTESGAFGTPAPAVPAQSGAGSAPGSTPPAAPPPGGPAIPARPTTPADYAALNAGWAAIK